MSLRITRWTSDTCGCIVDVQWDDAVSTESRAHTVAAHLPCPDHHGLPSGVGASFDADTFHPAKDNRRKNAALAMALEHVPALRDGTPGHFTLKADVGVAWTWTGTGANRTLAVSFSGVTVTAAQRTALHGAFAARFGAGAVVTVE